ncbi:unnamed protein product, partial [Symbiodinium sp. KB8]
MAHLADDMTKRRYNCRYEHCFRDESAIGVAKGIARECLPENLEASLMDKWYMWLLGHNWGK